MEKGQKKFVNYWVKGIETIKKQMNYLKADEKLEKFYQEKPLADLTFIVEGKEILAHKTLIAAKCPYFCDMFMSLFLRYSLIWWIF